MGLLERISASRTESRVIGGLPWRPWDSPYWRFDAGGPVHPSRAFYGVDQALGLPALYAGAKLLADNVASLPLKLYMKSPRPDAPARRYYGPSLFDKPSVSGTIFDWMFTAMSSLVLHGNAWGFITSRDGYGYPQGVEWIPPEDVNVVEDETQPFNPVRTRIYAYGRLMDKDDLFHVKAFALPGRTEGVSPLRAFAMTILAGMEAQRYGTDWYKAGGFPPGTFQNNEIEISQEQAEEIRSLLTSTIRRREPLVYGRDWDYKPVTVPPNEAQFIQAMQLNSTQIAAILGLPPDRIGGTRGDSLTYSTVEQGQLQIIEAMRPWLVRLETAFFELIPLNRYARFNADALLKTDLKTRTDIYKTQRDMGLRSIDELRDMEDLEPLPHGQGDENIPLEVMVAMSRSIRGIPTSMLPYITLEMDLAVKELENLQQEGLAQPDVPGQPVVPSTGSMLGQIVGQQRSAAGSQSRRDADLIMDFLEHRRRQLKARKNDPEFVGPWIPSPRELILAGYANGHSNGSENGFTNDHGGDDP